MARRGYRPRLPPPPPPDPCSIITIDEKFELQNTERVLNTGKTLDIGDDFGVLILDSDHANLSMALALFFTIISNPKPGLDPEGANLPKRDCNRQNTKWKTEFSEIESQIELARIAAKIKSYPSKYMEIIKGGSPTEITKIETEMLKNGVPIPKAKVAIHNKYAGAKGKDGKTRGGSEGSGGRGGEARANGDGGGVEAGANGDGSGSGPMGSEGGIEIAGLKLDQKQMIGAGVAALVALLLLICIGKKACGGSKTDELPAAPIVDPFASVPNKSKAKRSNISQSNSESRLLSEDDEDSSD